MKAGGSAWAVKSALSCLYFALWIRETTHWREIAICNFSCLVSDAIGLTHRLWWPTSFPNLHNKRALQKKNHILILNQFGIDYWLVKRTIFITFIRIFWARFLLYLTIQFLAELFSPYSTQTTKTEVSKFDAKISLCLTITKKNDIALILSSEKVWQTGCRKLHWDRSFKINEILINLPVICIDIS